MSKVYRLVVPMYEVVVYLAFSPEAIEKKFTVSDVCEGRCAEVAVMTRDDGYKMVYIVINNPDKMQNTITHECIHAAWRVLDLVGIEVDSDNHEALAYVAGWLADKIENKLAAEDVK